MKPALDLHRLLATTTTVVEVKALSLALTRFKTCIDCQDFFEWRSTAPTELQHVAETLHVETVRYLCSEGLAPDRGIASRYPVALQPAAEAFIEFCKPIIAFVLGDYAKSMKPQEEVAKTLLDTIQQVTDTFHKSGSTTRDLAGKPWLEFQLLLGFVTEGYCMEPTDSLVEEVDFSKPIGEYSDSKYYRFSDPEHPETRKFINTHPRSLYCNYPRGLTPAFKTSILNACDAFGNFYPIRPGGSNIFLMDGILRSITGGTLIKKIPVPDVAVALKIRNFKHTIENAAISYVSQFVRPHRPKTLSVHIVRLFQALGWTEEGFKKIPPFSGSTSFKHYCSQRIKALEISSLTGNQVAQHAYAYLEPPCKKEKEKAPPANNEVVIEPQEANKAKEAKSDKSSGKKKTSQKTPKSGGKASASDSDKKSDDDAPLPKVPAKKAPANRKRAPKKKKNSLTSSSSEGSKAHKAPMQSDVEDEPQQQLNLSRPVSPAPQQAKPAAKVAQNKDVVGERAVNRIIDSPAFQKQAAAGPPSKAKPKPKKDGSGQKDSRSRTRK